MHNHGHERIAFIAPQGVMVLKDDLFLKKQGSSAENGGQVIYVIEMARAMAASGHQVDIFARNYHSKDTEVEIDNCSGVRVIHIPTSADPVIEKEHFYPFYPEYLANVATFLNKDKNQYTSIIGHYADGMLIGACLEEYIKETTGQTTPFLGITHSLGLEKAESLHRSLAGSPDRTTQFGRLEDKFNIRQRLGCELSALSRADGMICVSQTHMKYLFDDYGYLEDQMAIVPGGIKGDVFYKKSEAEKIGLKEGLLANLKESRPDICDETFNALQNGQIVFGFGRLVRAKGVVNAVKSMEIILQRFPQAVYVYAGGNVPGKTEEEVSLLDEALEFAKSRGYADRVIFLGRQDQSDIADWLAVSNVYLHAAGLEPFGLAPQEAAATGIPCVISKYAGVAEVLENNIHALHIDPDNTKDIAKQVGRLLSNSDLADRLSEQAVEYVEKNATWAGRAKHIIDFIQRETRDLYFANRDKREINGNPYSNFAGRIILSDVFQRSVEGEQAQLISTAERIIRTILSQGLPITDTPISRLEFSERVVR